MLGDGVDCWSSCYVQMNRLQAPDVLKLRTKYQFILGNPESDFCKSTTPHDHLFFLHFRETKTPWNHILSPLVHDGTPRMLQDQQEKKLQRFLEDSDRLGRSRKLDMARDAAKMALHGTRWDNGPMVVSLWKPKKIWHGEICKLLWFNYIYTRRIHMFLFRQ